MYTRKLQRAPKEQGGSASEQPGQIPLSKKKVKGMVRKSIHDLKVKYGEKTVSESLSMKGNALENHAKSMAMTMSRTSAREVTSELIFEELEKQMGGAGVWGRKE